MASLSITHTSRLYPIDVKYSSGTGLLFSQPQTVDTLDMDYTVTRVRFVGVLDSD